MCRWVRTGGASFMAPRCEGPVLEDAPLQRVHQEYITLSSVEDECIEVSLTAGVGEFRAGVWVGGGGGGGVIVYYY